jgi:hypothetical protein
MGLMSLFWFITPEGQFKRRLQNTRRKWDRLREKVDRKDYSIKSNLLDKLDTIEQDIKTLERRESDMRIQDKRKIVSQVEVGLEEVKDMIREEEIGQKKEVGDIENKVRNYA